MQQALIFCQISQENGAEELGKMPMGKRVSLKTLGK